MSIVYTACIGLLDYAHKIAVFNYFSINSTVLPMKCGCREGCSRAKNSWKVFGQNSEQNR